MLTLLAILESSCFAWAWRRKLKHPIVFAVLGSVLLVGVATSVPLLSSLTEPSADELKVASVTAYYIRRTEPGEALPPQAGTTGVYAKAMLWFAAIASTALALGAVLMLLLRWAFHRIGWTRG